MIIAVQLEKNPDEIRRLDNKSSGVTISVEKSSFLSDMWLAAPPTWVSESFINVLCRYLELSEPSTYG